MVKTSMTGRAGFIGSYVMEVLPENGYEVFVPIKASEMIV